MSELTHVTSVFEITDSEHFCSTDHRWIARAIKAVWQSGRPADVVTVATYLNEIGKLGEVGRSEYLAQLIDTIPACSLGQSVAYAEIVRKKWQLRTFKAEALILVAQCQTGSIEDPAKAFREAANRVEGIAATAAGIERLSGNEIFATPNHIDSMVPGLGIKPGPVVMVVARSGIGKSVILQAAAVASVLGKPWWGLFAVQRPLRVIWIDLEQGKQTTLLRFKRLALGLDLTPDELCGWLDVVISPDVSSDASLEKLFDGYDLAFIDCFRVMAGGIDENVDSQTNP